MKWYAWAGVFLVAAGLLIAIAVNLGAQGQEYSIRKPPVEEWAVGGSGKVYVYEMDYAGRSYLVFVTTAGRAIHVMEKKPSP